MQGVTPQEDGWQRGDERKIRGASSSVLHSKAPFKGSIGEVSGAKMTAALNLACADNEKGYGPTR